jgi:hypothetical protein
MLNRPKRTFKNIIYTEDKLKFIEQKLAKPTLSEYQNTEYPRRFAGGECATYHKIPTKMASLAGMRFY